MNSGDPFDVAVVGAGAAGTAAALAAARSGARTVLLERDRAAGGNVRGSLVHTICGLYIAGTQGEPEHAHGGFPRAFVDALTRRGGTGDAPRRARSAIYLPIDPNAFSSLATELLRNHEGLTTAFGHELAQADLAHSPTAHSRLVTETQNEMSEFHARIVIDTSGDAVAAVAGGASIAVASPDELQHPSFIFRMDGVDTGCLDGVEAGRVSVAVARAARGGELPADAESVVVRRGSRDGEAYVTLNLAKTTGSDFAPLDNTYRRALEATAKHAAGALAAFIVRTREAFRSARISALAERLGIRETRRIEGVVRVGKHDVLRAVRRDDEVCISTWPIELWTSHRRVRFEPTDGPCSVPLGALVSASHPSLLMAGRCMSASHEALGALRVLGTAMATGEAAGITAALAAANHKSPADIEPALVRRQIASLAQTGWNL